LVQKFCKGSGASVFIEGVPQAPFMVEVGEVQEVSVIPALQNQFDLFGEDLAASVPYLGGYFF
jgi:hypothetical protein